MPERGVSPLFSEKSLGETKHKNTEKMHYGYVIVLCCFWIMFFIVGLAMSCAGIFYKPISESLGVHVGTLGVYMSLNFLFSALTLSFAGKVMEKYGVRKTLTLSSVTVAATFMLMASFNAVWQFYIAGAVLGIALAFLLYLGFPTLLNRWFKKRLGIFIGICSAGSGIGGALLNPLAGYLITEYGWRVAYLVFGAGILLLVTPVLGFFLREYPEDLGLQAYGNDIRPATGEPEKESGIEYSRSIRMPIFYGLILFAFLMNATATLNIFIPAYMQDIQFSVEQSSFVASSAMIGVTIGKILLGMINDRDTRLGVLTMTLCGIGGLLLLQAGHYGLWFPLVGGFLFGWAYAAVSVQTPLLVRVVFGKKDYALIYSKIAMSIAIGGTIAAAVWGLLADMTSYRFIFTIGTVFLAVSGLISLRALKKKPETLRFIIDSEKGK